MSKNKKNNSLKDEHNSCTTLEDEAKSSKSNGDLDQLNNNKSLNPSLEHLKASDLNKNQKILKQLQHNTTEMSKTKAMWIRIAMLVFVFPVPWIIAIVLLIIGQATTINIPVYGQIICWLFPLLPLIGFIAYASFKLRKASSTMKKLGFNREKWLEENIKKEELKRASEENGETKPAKPVQQQTVYSSSNDGLIENLKSYKASKRELDKINQAVEDISKSNEFQGKVDKKPISMAASIKKFPNNAKQPLNKSNESTKAPASHIEINSNSSSNLDEPVEKPQATHVTSQRLQPDNSSVSVDFDLSSFVEEALVDEEAKNFKD